MTLSNGLLTAKALQKKIDELQKKIYEIDEGSTRRFTTDKEAEEKISQIVEKVIDQIFSYEEEKKKSEEDGINDDNDSGMSQDNISRRNLDT